MFFVFLLYALFASVFTVAKCALGVAEPIFLVGSRMALAGILMLGYSFIQHSSLIRLSRNNLITVLLLGIFNIYFTNVLEIWGLKYLSSSKTCFLYSLSPFLSALMSYIMLHERLSARKWLGLVIGCIGILPMLEIHNQKDFFQFNMPSLAECAVLGAVLSSVIGWILLRQLVHHNGCPPSVANGYSMLFGGVLALIQSAFVEDWNPIPVTDYSVWVKSTLFLIIISNIVCYNLYGRLLKHFSPTFMAFAGLSTAIFTAFFGWIFLGEHVTMWLFVSLVIVFVGLLIFYFEEIKGLEKREEFVPLKGEGTPPEILVPRATESVS